ncbi:hypothetical protein OAU02_01455 [Candidatus Pseudothioglobus singularis]|nr:hypothetical protein [Candidatus Pseudothioglobus singularis]
MSLSYYGRALVRKFKLSDDIDIVAIIDNDKKKWGEKFCGVSVLGPHDIDKIECDQYYVAGRYIKELVSQLKNQFNVPEEKINVMSRQDVIMDVSKINKRVKDLDSLMGWLIPLLEKNKINYWIDYSGLLSLMRNQDMAELSDVEICITRDKSNQVLDLIKGASQKNIRIDVTRIREALDFYQEGDIYAISLISKKNSLEDIEPAAITFIVKKIDDSGYASWKFGNQIRKDNGAYFSGFEEQDYKGMRLRIPISAKSYLKDLYGDDWEVPSKFWYGL